jgi:hypothetical protein
MELGWILGSDDVLPLPFTILLSRLCENSFSAQYTVGTIYHGTDVKRASGCSKIPDFSPAHLGEYFTLTP